MGGRVQERQGATLPRDRRPRLPGTAYAGVADFVARSQGEERKRVLQPTALTADEPLTSHKAAMLLLLRPERCGETERTVTEDFLELGCALVFFNRLRRGF